MAFCLPAYMKVWPFAVNRNAGVSGKFALNLHIAVQPSREKYLVITTCGSDQYQDKRNTAK